MAPRVGARRAKVFTGRHRPGALFMLLLVLNLRNLIGVLVVPHAPSRVRVLLPLEKPLPELLPFCTLIRVTVLRVLEVVLVIVKVMMMMVVVVSVKGVEMVVIVMRAGKLVLVQRLLKELCAATGRPRHRRSIFRRSLHQRIGVCWRVTVAKIRTVSTTANATRHPRLLNRLADHHAVLLKLLRQDGVQEGVAARVKGQNEDSEHFCLLQRD